jgi:hypothetical protein
MANVLDVKLSGWEETVDLTRLLRESAVALGRFRSRIQNRRAYTYWIEYGRYLHGRPGRRKRGPARMMRKGAKRIRDLAPDAIRRNIREGPQAVRRGLSGVMAEGTRVTKANTPVESGELRDNFHTVRSR